MPYHILFDQYEEERLGKGIFRLAVQSQALRLFIQINMQKIGYQVSELFDEELLKKKWFVL